MKTNKILLGILSCLALASCNVSNSTSDSTSIVNSSSSISTVDPLSKKLTTKVLGSIQDSITVQGSYDMIYEDFPDKPQTINTLQISDENSFYVHENNGTQSYEIHYINKNNFVALEYIDIKNTVQNEFFYDDLGNLIPWANFTYPFIGFSVNDFEEVSSGVYTIPNQQRAIEFVSAAYGYRHNKIESISLEVNDYKITKLSFTTEYFEDMYSHSLKHVATLEFKDHHTAKAPALKPYETVPEHARLKTALEKINTKNVTVMVENDDKNFGKSNYNVYYNADTYYSDKVTKDDNENDYTLGLMYRQDTIYEFIKYQDQPAELYSSPTMDFYTAYPNFDFAPELFEFVGNDTFKAHTNSAAMVGELVGVEYRGLIATTVEIKITANDEIEYVKYNYATDNYGGTDTLKFKDSGSTTIPVDLTALENNISTLQSISENLLNNAFSGTIEDLKYTIAFTRMGVYVENDLAQITSISEDGKVMTITVNDVTYDLSETTNGEEVTLSVTVNGTTYTFEMQKYDGLEEVYEIFPTEVLQEIFSIEIPEYTDGEMFECFYEAGSTFDMYVTGELVTLESDKAYAEILRAAGFTIDDSEYETTHTIKAQKEGTGSVLHMEIAAEEDQYGVYLSISIIEIAK